MAVPISSLVAQLAKLGAEVSYIRSQLKHMDPSLVGVPSGGSSGQVLMKLGPETGNYGWVNITTTSGYDGGFPFSTMVAGLDGGLVTEAYSGITVDGGSPSG